MMHKYLDIFRKVIPGRFQSRRFLLDQYHFDLTSFDGDLGAWLSKFPIVDNNVEIYLALAELFRRRGEFDKAVTIHEAIRHAPIKGYSKSQLQLEVAQDYYAAGMLGHAETVLISALKGAEDSISRNAFRLWLSILEHEQDWQRAVELVEQYGIRGSGGLRLANLYCEYAEQGKAEQPVAVTQRILRKARKLGVGARASLMSAELATQQGRAGEAIQLYREVLVSTPGRVNLVLPLLRRLSRHTDSEAQLLKFLQELYHLHPSVRILECILDLSETLDQPVNDEWRRTLIAKVSEGNSYPVYQYWMQQVAEVPDHVVNTLAPVLQRHSLAETDVHVCTECGYYSDSMLWQCPQCDAWETLFSQYELKIARQLKKGS